MKRKLLAAWSVVALFALLTGCATNIHGIGSGPAGSDVLEKRQWYILFGLVPINTVDTAAMAGTATNYEITTQQSVLDIVFNIFTSYVTITSRTVTVKK